MASTAVHPWHMCLCGCHVLRPAVCIHVAMQVGTPLCIPTKDGIDLGRIASLELNHKSVQTARAGDSVAMKIECEWLGRGSAGLSNFVLAGVECHYVVCKGCCHAATDH